MKIILGKTSGFCYGVKRAVDGATEELKKGTHYCLGEIIHNKNVIKKLEQKGMKFVENVDDAIDKIIIRAHGIPKEVYKRATDLNIKVKDLTCPSVLKIHEMAEKYSRDGYFIILVGAQAHPEVIGTFSFCGNESFVINDINDVFPCIEKIELSNLKNVLVIAQTTYNSEKFDEIVKSLKENLKDKNLEIKKTICTATEMRQKETAQIAKNVDIMIIIGDKKSSNTNKLCDISKKYCKNVFLVQNKDELKKIRLFEANNVGIMGGASTPEEDIKEIIATLEGIYNKKKEEYVSMLKTNMC